MDDVSNARPLAIFFGYLILAASLTAACIAIIRAGPGRRTSPQSTPTRRPRAAVAVFVFLAVSGLAITWYHMFRFFFWSYEQWALVHPEGGDTLRLGNWLRDTKLFEQAWAATLETAPRAWWSLQIFGFCGVWSVMLACEGESCCETVLPRGEGERIRRC